MVLSSLFGHARLVCASPQILYDVCSADSFVSFHLRAVGSSPRVRREFQVVSGGVNARIHVRLFGLLFVGVLFAVVGLPRKVQSSLLILCGSRYLFRALGALEVTSGSFDARVGFYCCSQLVCGLQ